MNLKILILLIVLPLCAACSSIRVVPEQAATGIINAADNSQTITKNGAEIRAAIADTEMNAYNLDSVLASFFLGIRNTGTTEIVYSADSFVLVDDRGIQYEALPPEKIREIIKKDSYYLMPYPYVGFYYQQDYDKTNFYNRTTSALPYYYEMYPQDIFTRALPLAPIIPAMKVEGVVYFKIDLSARSQVKLSIYRKGASKASPPEFIFPFKIVK